MGLWPGDVALCRCVFFWLEMANDFEPLRLISSRSLELALAQPELAVLFLGQSGQSRPADFNLQESNGKMS